MTKVLFLRNKEPNAYFTVEATLVMAVVLPMIFFLMSWMFFSYNRCLLEQDLQVLTLRGAVLKGDKDEVMREIKTQEKTLYRDKYVAVEMNELSVKLDGNKVRLSQSARMPLWGGGMLKIGKTWDIKASCMNHRIEETVFLRACRKIKHGKVK